jgi:hypothetical protein
MAAFAFQEFQDRKRKKVEEAQPEPQLTVPKRYSNQFYIHKKIRNKCQVLGTFRMVTVKRAPG